MTEKLGEGRILGIDFGARRIGMALSDPLRILATSYGMLKNGPLLWSNLEGVLQKERIVFAVVGMPFNLDGSKSRQSASVEEFIAGWKTRFSMELVTWDERFTTALAQRTMITMGTTKKQRKERDGRIDAMAAAIMLQGFLDSTKQSMSC